MTRLEKARELRPDLSEERIIYEFCPWRFFKWSKEPCYKAGWLAEICPTCWKVKFEEVKP